MIAAIVPTIASPMFSAPMQAFTDVLGRAGYHVLLGLSGYEAGGEDALIRAVLTPPAGRLLLTGASHSPQVRRLLPDARRPGGGNLGREPKRPPTCWSASTTPRSAPPSPISSPKAVTRHFAVLAAGDPRAAAAAGGLHSPRRAA